MKAGRRSGVHFWLLATAGLFVLLPAQVEAHTPVQGLGEFASGFLHPLLTLPHVLVLGALGVLLGQRQPLRLKSPVIILAGFAAAGLLVTVTGAVAKLYPPALIMIALCIGALVALALPLPAWLYLAICAVAALAVGLDSGIDAGTARAAAAKTLFGTWVSMVLCVFNLAFYVSILPKYRWVQTALRVVGSWVVAITLLMLAFAFRH